jgi:hypothetical protein
MTYTDTHRVVDWIKLQQLTVLAKRYYYNGVSHCDEMKIMSEELQKLVDTSEEIGQCPE